MNLRQLHIANAFGAGFTGFVIPRAAVAGLPAKVATPTSAAAVTTPEGVA